MKPYLAFTTPVFLVSILVTLLLTGEPGSSQGLLRRLDTANPQPGGRFGEEVATGDVNGDGRADIAVGAVQEDVGAVPDAGRVYVFDGATGALIYGLNTPNPQRNAFFGAALALGDVDADGKNDIAVGAHFETVAGHTFQGRVYIFSATSGTLLRILDTPQPENAVLFGRSLAMGDADGDGKDDIAVGAPQQTAGQVEGKVYLFSGATGDLILTLDAPTQQQLAKFGSSLAMGEVDGDGKADIAVGAPREFTNIQGRAYVYSGDGGGLLYTLDSPAPKPSGLFGSALAMGDADGDGRADISVGAEGEAVTGGHSQHGRA